MIEVESTDVENSNVFTLLNDREINIDWSWYRMPKILTIGYSKEKLVAVG